MKILSRKTDRLVLEISAPGAIVFSVLLIVGGLVAVLLAHGEHDTAGRMFGCVAGLVGAYLFIVASDTIRVTLDTSQNQALIQRTGLFGSTSNVSHPLSTLKGAFVTEGPEQTTGLELRFHCSEHSVQAIAITQVHSDGVNHQKDADAINTWLANHAPVDSTPPQA